MSPQRSAGAERYPLSAYDPVPQPRYALPHVDHTGADLDPLGTCTDRGQQRERGAELTGEVVHPEVGAVRAELLGRHGELDRLHQGDPGGAHHRLRVVRPVPEGQEADVLHLCLNASSGGVFQTRVEGAAATAVLLPGPVPADGDPPPRVGALRASPGETAGARYAEPSPERVVRCAGTSQHRTRATAPARPGRSRQSRAHRSQVRATVRLPRGRTGPSRLPVPAPTTSLSVPLRRSPPSNVPGRRARRRTAR